MKRLCLALAAASVLTAGPAVASDDWPNRPVRVISTFAAGGTADILARIVAEHLSTAFKQQFFVEVRAGAGGQIGVRQVMESPPDGYNLAVTNVSHLVLHPMTRSDVTYNPQTDLTNIAFVGGSPVVLSTNVKRGFKSLQDFIETGKKERLPYSSSGLGSMGHLVAVNLINLTGIQAEHVPYKGASQALADLVGSHIVWSSQTVSSTASYLRSGTLKGVAVSTAQRLPDWPDLPTFKEQGVDLEASIWFTLSGPPKLPATIVKKLNDEVARALKDPKIVERFKQDGLIAQPMTPEQLAKFVDSETRIWGPVVKAAGLEAKKK